MAKKKSTTSEAAKSVATKTKPRAPEAPSPKLNIALRGACQHNLQNLDLDFPIHELTVLCGVSGSGKSSLAFDTLYAEGQRRYIESFSAYTRQFLQRLDKPKFETLEPLPPSIAVTRDARSRNNRSTVGTASEILEYLRVVFASLARLYCIECGTEVIAHTHNTILDSLSKEPAARAMVGFEIHWTSAEDLASILADLQSTGYVRMVVGDKSWNLGSSERDVLAKAFQGKSVAYVIVDRLQWTGVREERWEQSLAASLDQAALHPPSRCCVYLEDPAGETEVDGKSFRLHFYSPTLQCEQCGREYPEADSSLFNFNHPLGACPECEGFGETIAIDPDKVVPDKSMSIADGAIAPWRTPSYSHELDELLALADDYKIPVHVPVSKLTKAQWKWIQDGVPERKFGGLRGFFNWLERKKYKMHVRVFLSRWRTYSLCNACQGKRLNPQSLAYRLQKKTFSELCELPIDALVKLIDEEASIARPATWKRDNQADETRLIENEQLDAPKYGSGAELEGNSFWMAAERHSQFNASEPVRQVLHRLEYMQDIGLGYVSLDRPMHTLSSGEAQRVNLTTLLGSSLVDMLYVFDEPTVGLHPADVEKVSRAILKIRDRGNTVILVEHEPAMIQMADRILEIGPEAGSRGGKLVFDGTPAELIQSKSITGQYLRGDRPRPRRERVANRFLELEGAEGRNLKGDRLKIPAGCLTVVVGPSGAGKSSLILDTLLPACQVEGAGEKGTPLSYKSLKNFDLFGGYRSMDQSPIPRSSRSTPATYCKAMDAIRDVFAATPEAKSKRLTSGHFSFNSDAGRCPTCEGIGTVNVEMQFMADVALPCPDCNGKRFKPEVLEIGYRDRNIYDVLQMSVEGATDFFRGEGEIQSRLRMLLDIGLGYLPLGQNLSTLSTGESMRLKLAAVLSDSTRKKAGELIAMDEPTTGLHFVDIDRLLDCLDLLLERGNTFIVIEHNQQFIDAADYIVEIGPGAGPNGGSIVYQGSWDRWQGNIATSPHRS